MLAAEQVERSKAAEDAANEVKRLKIKLKEYEKINNFKEDEQISAGMQCTYTSINIIKAKLFIYLFLFINTMFISIHIIKKI